MSNITSQIRSTSNWNRDKLAELSNRVRFCSSIYQGDLVMIKVYYYSKVCLTASVSF